MFMPCVMLGVSCTVLATVGHTPVVGKAELATLVQMNRLAVPPLEVHLAAEERCTGNLDFIVAWEELISFSRSRFRIEIRYAPGGADGLKREKLTIGAYDGASFMSVANGFGAVSASDAQTAATGMANSDFWVALRWQVPSQVAGEPEGDDILDILAMQRSELRPGTELVNGAPCLVLDIWPEGSGNLGHPMETYWLDPTRGGVILRSISWTQQGAPRTRLDVTEVWQSEGAWIPAKFAFERPASPNVVDPPTASGTLVRSYRVVGAPVVVPEEAISTQGPAGVQMTDLETNDTWVVRASPADLAGEALRFVGRSRAMPVAETESRSHLGLWLVGSVLTFGLLGAGVARRSVRRLGVGRA